MLMILIRKEKMRTEMKMVWQYLFITTLLLRFTVRAVRVTIEQVCAFLAEITIFCPDDQ